jgi:putative addiction module killer protein
LPGCQIRIFETKTGKSPFLVWLSSLDKSMRMRVQARIQRFAMGNLGQNRHLGEGLFEAKLDHGPGYRVYFGMHAGQLIVLLCGGDKSGQSVDILKAQTYWAQYLAGKED